MTEEKLIRRRYYEIGLQIEKQLFSGFFKVGDRLPSERDLSQQYETSRATIREAIIMLELKDLVEVKKGAGIFFKENTNNKKGIKTKNTNNINEVGPFELLQSRLVLEVSIVEFAAKNIKLSELRQLKNIIQRQENSFGDSEQFETLDREFHLCIAEATQNRMLIDTANRLWNIVRTENILWQQLNKKYLHDTPLKESWLAEHRKIFAALQKRDPMLAREAMIEHIEHSKQELTNLIDYGDIELLEHDDMFFIEDK